MDDSGDLVRQRRNLVSLSVGLIIFILAEGHFRSSGGVLAFPVRFDNPSIIYYVLWMLLLYFLWRYWIFGGKNADDKMRDRIYAKMRGDAKYREKIRRFHYEEMTDAFSRRKDSAEVQGQVKLQLVDLNFDFKIGKPNRLVRANAKLQIGDDRASAEKMMTHKVKFIGLEGPFLIKHFFLVSYREEGFSDYILPFLLCDVAAVMGAISAYLKADLIH